MTTKEQQLAAREARLKADQEALERQRTEFAERERSVQDQERATRRAEIAEFVGALVTDGQVLPAQRAGLVAFMESLPAEAVVEFGEGDSAMKKPGTEWFRDYLKAQPKVVDFAERAGGALPKDLTAADLANKAIEFQESERKAGREVSITAAVTHVKTTLAAG